MPLTKTRAAVIRGFDLLVEELGGDYRKVAGQAGLDLEQIADPDALIESSVVKAILDFSASETGCFHFGLLLAHRLDQENYLGVLGQVIQSAPTLGVALEDGFNYIGLHTGASLWQLHTSDEVSYVTYALLETTRGRVATKTNERAKLERLCRYITRPAVSTKRLSITRNGRVRYELKTPWRNGTTHVIFEPLDFISRLVALVPKPRINLTRFHGVFAPNSKYRSRVTPAGRGKGKKSHSAYEADQSPAEKRASMTWAKRLKRVFNIEVETCAIATFISLLEGPLLLRIIRCLPTSKALQIASSLGAGVR